MRRTGPGATLLLVAIWSGVSAQSHAAVTLELRPTLQVVMAGQTVEVALYAVADPEEPVGIIGVIPSWDPVDLALQDPGWHGEGAYPWNPNVTGFPDGGPDPDEGHAYYFATVTSCDETAPASPSGLKVTTFLFTATANTGQTLVSILPSFDVFQTEVYDGLCDPKNEVLGGLGTPVTVTIISCGDDEDCDDDNACTTDWCNLGVCSYELNFPAAYFCCDPATGELTLLSDGSDCTKDDCNQATGQVTHPLEPGGTLCGDESDTTCTDPDTCNHAGLCLPNHAQDGNFCVNDCTEGPDICVDGVCDAGGANPCPPISPSRPFCQDRPHEGGPCPNGDPDCDTASDFWCVDGNGDPCPGGGVDCVCRRSYACVECETTADCPDSGNCYNFVCFGDGFCRQIVDSTYCDDGLLCNGEEWCELDMFVGFCRNDAFPQCAGEICREETCCQDGICHELLCDCVECVVDVDCDDGDPCNGVEACDPDLFVCAAGTPIDCSPLDDDCNIGVCDPATGLCDPQVIPELIGVPGSCDDGIPCTFADACTADGGCVGESPALNGGVNLQWDPNVLDAQTSVAVGGTVSLDLYAVANDGFNHDIDVVEAVIVWDPAVMELAPGTVPVDPCAGTSVLCRTCADSPLSRCTEDFTQTCVNDGNCPGASNLCEPFCRCIDNGDCGWGGLECFCPGGPPCAGYTGVCVTGVYDWFGSTFAAGPFDPDGLNLTWTDGDARYAALAQQDLSAPLLGDDPLWITTIEFTAVGGSAGSEVAFTACTGESPSRTRILGDGAGNEITGSLGTITIQVAECGVDGDCIDGVDCTDDACVEQVCVNTPNDGNCPDDEMFCNGSEVCDADQDCVSTGNPCVGQGLLCEEALGGCVECLSDGDCDDGADCTTDTCDANGNCRYEDTCPDDGWFCTGIEFCNVQTAACDQTGDPCPGSCDEDNDSCPCLAPLVEVAGPRYIAITPQPLISSSPLSFVVTSPDWPCLSKYVGGFLECGDTEAKCQTDADCNQCTDIAGACLTDDDCKLCTDNQTRCRTDQDCPGGFTCSIQYSCMFSGDTCDLQPLRTMDLNGDGLDDGMVATLVDDPADAALLTPEQWGTLPRHCSVSLEPCMIDVECDVGVCNITGKACSITLADCPMACQAAQTACEVDAHCPPGDACTIVQACELYETCAPGRVYVTGEDILPSELVLVGEDPVIVPTRYEVWADCGGLAGPVEVTMPGWSDADGNEVVNFDDIQAAILAFENVWPIRIPGRTRVAVDIVGSTPCAVEQVVNFTDINFFIFAFEGEHYNPDVLSTFDECGVPCP